jgi:hypothetical protein
MESTWLTKRLYKQALKTGKVYLTLEIQTRNGVTGYNLYILKNGDMLKVCGHSPYWSDKKRCYHVTCWGTSRPLEVILSVGRSLGLRFHEMSQNYTVL